MEFTEKKIWKKASAIGFAFSVACLLVCILQYHVESNANTFQKTVRLTMNFMALNLFFFPDLQSSEFPCICSSFLCLWEWKFPGQRKHPWLHLHSPFLSFFKYNGFLLEKKTAQISTVFIRSCFLSLRTGIPHRLCRIHYFRDAHNRRGTDLLPCMASAYPED